MAVAGGLGRGRVVRAAVGQAGRAALNFGAMHAELSRRKSIRVGQETADTTDHHPLRRRTVLLASLAVMLPILVERPRRVPDDMTATGADGGSFVKRPSETRPLG